MNTENKNIDIAANEILKTLGELNQRIHATEEKTPLLNRFGDRLVTAIVGLVISAIGLAISFYISTNIVLTKLKVDINALQTQTMKQEKSINDYRKEVTDLKIQVLSRK